MKKIVLKILAVLTLVFGAFAINTASPATADVYADCAGAKTSIINCDENEKEEGGGIFVVINIVLNVMTFGVGIAGTLGIVITGIMYLTARDNEAQMTKAKSRLINIVIGLAAYAVMWAFLQWLLPGGIFGGQ